MKTILLFLFAMLVSVVAGAAVKVTPLNTNYSTQEVTFKVEWQNASVPYNNRVWVWIDFCPVTGTTPANSFSTATVSNPTKTGGNGTITGQTARGFFIEYANATNASTTVTAKLSNAISQFNWCAYGSDYPPNAAVNAGGGYTLRGTLPFTVNGNQTVNSNTFGAGTCITSITDPTGRPDGFTTLAPAISNPNSPSRCNAGAVTISATVSGGTTTAMTYTWNVGGTNYTTTTNSYTTTSLSSSVAYTVKVKNANNCESNTASGNITVNYPGTNGQSSSPCGCATGTTACSGTCKTNTTYYNDGECTGECGKRYRYNYNQCGLISTTTIDDSNCVTGCEPEHTTTCNGQTGTTVACQHEAATPDVIYTDCVIQCKALCAAYRFYGLTLQSVQGPYYYGNCHCCN